MIPLKINNQSVRVPQSWKEITFRQYEQFIEIKDNDLFDVVCVFTGIKKEIWEASKQVANFYLIEQALSFINKPPKLKGIKCPYEIAIKGKTVQIPQTEDEYIVKEYEDLRATIQMLSKENENIGVKSYHKLIAPFLVRRIFSEYNTSNLMATEELIKELRLYDVIGMANFFLKNLIGLRGGTRTGWRLWNTIRKKVRLVLINLKYGVFSIR